MTHKNLGYINDAKPQAEIDLLQLKDQVMVVVSGVPMKGEIIKFRGGNRANIRTDLGIIVTTKDKLVKI